MLVIQKKQVIPPIHHYIKMNLSYIIQIPGQISTNYRKL